MSDPARIYLVGNVTRDPELRFSATGTAVTSFSVAVNSSVNKKDGTRDEKVSFYDITAFGAMAENACESLQKGVRAIVFGRMEQDSWESNGERKTRFKVIADDLGPSLRWATAPVTRNERVGAQNYAAAPAAPPQAAAPQEPAREYSYDDEPF